MSAEGLEQNIFGGYDDIEFDGIDELQEICQIIDGLTKEARRFVLAHLMQRMDT